jgi:hypothetical protein
MQAAMAEQAAIDEESSRIKPSEPEPAQAESDEIASVAEIEN